MTLLFDKLQRKTEDSAINLLNISIKFHPLKVLHRVEGWGGGLPYKHTLSFMVFKYQQTRRL